MPRRLPLLLLISLCTVSLSAQNQGKDYSPRRHGDTENGKALAKHRDAGALGSSLGCIFSV
jgi:hypothetical protein